MADSTLRPIDPPFVGLGPSGVAIRDRLKGLTPADEKVLRTVGEHLGFLAGRDLKARCAAGLDHDTDAWADRKRALTEDSSSRWAGSITKASHDQWALSRRAQLAHIQCLEAGIATIGHRLSLPVGRQGQQAGAGRLPHPAGVVRQDAPPAPAAVPAAGQAGRPGTGPRTRGTRRQAAAECAPQPGGRPAH